MLDAQRYAFVTLAGTGEVGFGGDGGLGRKALLRHPEGLALKPNMAEGQEAASSSSFCKLFVLEIVEMDKLICQWM